MLEDGPCCVPPRLELTSAPEFVWNFVDPKRRVSTMLAMLKRRQIETQYAPRDASAFSFWLAAALPLSFPTKRSLIAMDLVSRCKTQRSKSILI